MTVLGSRPERAQEIVEVAGIMASYRKWWAIGGGWAVDLALARVTREHDDVEVCVLRRDLGEIRGLVAGWRTQLVVPDPAGRENAGSAAPWGGELVDLPIHQIRARRDESRLDLLLNEASGDEWTYRRDARVSRALAEAANACGAVRYLAPGIVLLFKSKHLRPKDEADFRELLPSLAAGERHFLADSLRLIHRGHPWLSLLEGHSR